MTQMTGTLPTRAASNARFVGSICAAHFISHYYFMLLPPLFDFVRADYGVSYTELGLALVCYNVVSAILQTPAGFLIDRVGARALLIAGLLLGACAVAVAALVNSFWVLVVMFGVLGVANTVYHPADYALLSHHTPPERIAKVFSIHTFSGIFGSAAAPVTLLMMQSLWGWRGAFLGAALLGFAVALLLIVQRDPPETVRPAPLESESTAPVGWRLLVTRTALCNLLFFALLALTSGGLQYYSVVALGALYGTPASIANTALTANLTLSAIGVLAGGYLATHTTRHASVAVIGSLMVGSASLLIAGVNPGSILLVAAMAVAGFSSGATMPSRDMIVRAVTPPGAFGTVFGFVATGFNLGGIVTPFVYGLAMDHGQPRAVFLLVAVFSVLTILTITGTRKRA
jgi:MFS family permease